METMRTRYEWLLRRACFTAALLLVPAGLYGQGEPGAGPPPAIWISALIAAVAFGVAAVLVIRARRPKSNRRGQRFDPPLIIPEARGAGAPRPYIPTPRPAPRPEFAPPVAPIPAPEAQVGRAITFTPPPDGTLQLLPGRLEIVEGEERGQSIRFVRTGGSPEITFGRSEGLPYRHVQLHSPTVSREHARMRLDKRTWMIANLSHTNPVVVNGDELNGAGKEHPLQDGDRVEMGEVVFEFREQ